MNRTPPALRNQKGGSGTKRERTKSKSKREVTPGLNYTLEIVSDGGQYVLREFYKTKRVRTYPSKAKKKKHYVKDDFVLRQNLDWKTLNSNYPGMLPEDPDPFGTIEILLDPKSPKEFMVGSQIQSINSDSVTFVDAVGLPERNEKNEPTTKYRPLIYKRNDSYQYKVSLVELEHRWSDVARGNSMADSVKVGLIYVKVVKVAIEVATGGILAKSAVITARAISIWALRKAMTNKRFWTRLGFHVIRWGAKAGLSLGKVAVKCILAMVKAGAIALEQAFGSFANIKAVFVLEFGATIKPVAKKMMEVAAKVAVAGAATLGKELLEAAIESNSRYKLAFKLYPMSSQNRVAAEIGETLKADLIKELQKLLVAEGAAAFIEAIGEAAIASHSMAEFEGALLKPFKAKFSDSILKTITKILESMGKAGGAL